MVNKPILLIRLGAMITVIVLINLLFFKLEYVTVISTILLLILLLILHIKGNLLYSDYSQESCHLEKDSQNEYDIKSTLSQIAALLTQQNNIVDTEIDRTNTLIKEAVVGISKSFKYLKQLSDEQQNMINEVIGNHNSIIEKLKSSVEIMASADMTSSLEAKNRVNLMLEQLGAANIRTKVVVDELAALSPKINDAVVQGVRSLQFEDLACQTLSALKENLSTISSLNERINEFDCKNSNIHQQLQLLQQHCQTLFEQSQYSNVNRNVTQSSMDEGEIELF